VIFPLHPVEADMPRPITAHSEYAAIRRAVQSAHVLAAPWKGAFFRAVHPRFASNADIVSGVGSLNYGARWNAPGSFAAVYGSLRVATALAEALAASRKAGIDDADAMPVYVTSVRAKLARVLDLTRPNMPAELSALVARGMGEPWQEFTGKDSICQAIGRAAYEAELQGLIVPSLAAPGETNIVVFRVRVSQAALAPRMPIRGWRKVRRPA